MAIAGMTVLHFLAEIPEHSIMVTLVFFQAEDGIRDVAVTGVQTCALPISNGAETPRLLLLSAYKQFPDGLANSSGLVGKNLMFNSGGTVTGVYEQPLNDYKGYCVSRVLHDFYELNHEKVGFYGGGGLDARYDFTPISFAFGGIPPETPRWGKEFKATLAHNFTRDRKSTRLNSSHGYISYAVF